MRHSSAASAERERPPLRARLLLAAVSTVIALLGGEIVARPFEDRTASRYTELHGFHRFDPVLGWSDVPGKTGVFVRAEFSHPVSINEHGMRYRAVSRERRPGVARLAVLGDSFAWGLGVRVEDRL